MTDYVKAYLNGANPYHREAMTLAGRLKDEATIVDGVIRWNSNNQVPPAECVALAVHIGLPVDPFQSASGRDTETREFLAAYRAARANGPTDEERVEARAAFGSGVAVTDVVTGRKWRT